MEEAFHTRLKRLRMAQNFSTKAFARKIEVPESTYRTWESGGGIQGQPYLKIGRALGISLHELFTGDSAEPRNILLLVNQLEELNQKLKRELLSLK